MDIKETIVAFDEIFRMKIFAASPSI